MQKFDSYEEKGCQKIEIVTSSFQFSRKKSQSRIQKINFKRNAAIIFDERSRIFVDSGRDFGRPLVFLRPDLCQRAVETGYEWLVGTGWEAHTGDQNSGRCQSATMQSLNKLPHLSKTIFYTATTPARTAVMGEGFSALEKKNV